MRDLEFTYRIYKICYGKYNKISDKCNATIEKATISHTIIPYQKENGKPIIERIGN